jgi:tRNA(Arg) A34 adenosine deaminase TadA
MGAVVPGFSRRRFSLSAALAALGAGGAGAQPHSWYEAAREMQRQAESWGDQSYGAVLVLNGRIVGQGPSRVIASQDPWAHAEREAIRDAQRSLKRTELEGAILVSTSRPCRVCENAAAQAGVARMFFGRALEDAGRPRRIAE